MGSLEGILDRNQVAILDLESILCLTLSTGCLDIGSGPLLLLLGLQSTFAADRNHSVTPGKLEGVIIEESANQLAQGAGVFRSREFTQVLGKPDEIISVTTVLREGKLASMGCGGWWDVLKVGENRRLDHIDEVVEDHKYIAVGTEGSKIRGVDTTPLSPPLYRESVIITILCHVMMKLTLIKRTSGFTLSSHSEYVFNNAVLCTARLFLNPISQLSSG